ncbi:gliding motility associated protien GldN [Lishizhenia tianjinensis]|uniref:Gliding motility associated protien GldN n=1 Tax=Lishizhenia tianjinensis TaxID=477690 RepID=A0A1I7BSE1_9FLAO|nr:gliding motility protein GldN [Lishizhenia tianjinensis]SFT90095.1 gliding motility associated protien GldN [Lishizhenia tianjinensis]
MQVIRNVSLFIVVLVLPLLGEAQPGPINANQGIIDGPVMRTTIPTKRLIPYDYQREADVVWSKRVWRSLDMRQKLNHSMYYPLDGYDSDGNWIRHNTHWSLWTVIKTEILAGNITVYSPYNPVAYTITDGDQFKYPILPKAGGNYNSDSVYREELSFYLYMFGEESDVPYVDIYGYDSIDQYGNLVYPPREMMPYSSKDIVSYKLKEDWFFNKETSTLDVRIIGIAPEIYVRDAQGRITGKKELFWLYFPECRYAFNNYLVYNEKNDAQWMSYDDLFWKRRFASTIIKESNVYDRDISTYRVGVDALLQAEQITEEIRNLEHDFWSY